MKIHITKKFALISALIILGTVVIDFATKQLIMHTMTNGESIPLIKDFLHITFITNDGMAFGKLDDARWVFMTVSMVMIIGFLSVILLWEDKNPLFYVSASMVVGGGIGNMIDRIFYGDTLFHGEVVDFIDFCGIWSYIFNGADSFVCVGACLLVLYYIISEIKNHKKANAENSDDGDEAK